MNWNLIKSVSVLGISALALSSSIEAKPAKDSKPEVVPGEFIVRMKNGVRAQSAEMAISSMLKQTLGVSGILSVESLAMDSRIQKVTIRDAKAATATLQTLRSNPQIKYAEPNYVYRKLVTPNDTDFSRQWDMVNTGQADKAGQVGTVGADINVAPVWDRGITGSRNVLVAVIDTGVDYNHHDLRDNIYTNPNEIAGDGIDNDGNGVIDDVHGANFVAGGVGTGASMDDNEHGTHCAGTIGAVGNNGVGLVGVNWQVSILPVKFLSAEGSGSSEGAINAIKYATRMGANVLSNSWGGGPFSEALRDAIQESNDAGAIFIAAAGNSASNNDARPSYPASYEIPNIVSVAATDNKDRIASFSNYGRNTVHVAAPGVNILSTVPGNRYDTFSGTSMACPHVAGMAALLWSANPSMTAVQIKERLMNTSVPVSGLRTKTAARGRVDMLNAIDNVVPASPWPADTEFRDFTYALESAHPYVDNLKAPYQVRIPGARFIRVFFEKIDTEAGYDYVAISDASGAEAERISGTMENYMTDFVQGDTLNLKFVTDSSITKWGFKISKLQVVY